jgi:hypothetical protein
MKLFYSEDKYSSGSYNMDWYKDYLDISGKQEIELNEYKIDSKGDFRFCKILLDTFDKNDTRDMCGRENCNDYIPKNGRWGKCKNLDNSLIKTGRKIRLIKKDNFFKEEIILSENN